MKAPLVVLILLACGHWHPAASRSLGAKDEVVSAGRIGGGGSTAPRIAGGQPAAPGQFPWIALLYVNQGSASNPALVHYCTGTLVAQDLVLTTAHCTFYEDGTDLVPIVRVGLTNANDTSVPQRTVVNIFRHPEYDKYTYANDAALLQLSKPISYRRPLVKMAANYTELVEDQKLFVLGFGDTPTTFMSVQLLYTTVKFVPRQYCMKFYQDYYAFVVPSSAICAGSLNANNMCQGDSGAPLITEDGKQVGFAAFGPKLCGGVANIAGYTNVMHLRRFINNTIRQVVQSRAR